ncbi:hypothetical protein CC80DRAFT_551755 [Byssothecium circinans]|uniref:Uncharacterized protein n=1 Tax=Byssothecium circinans TaxID=147558 RepID=A0A6A5TVU3_9PLEO|nr:hypothetical protein CC80DRAFT_551755 [Byssothecium circinans]
MSHHPKSTEPLSALSPIPLHDLPLSPTPLDHADANHPHYPYPSTLESQSQMRSPTQTSLFTRKNIPWLITTCVLLLAAVLGSGILGAAVGKKTVVPTVVQTTVVKTVEVNATTPTQWHTATQTLTSTTTSVGITGVTVTDVRTRSGSAGREQVTKTVVETVVARGTERFRGECLVGGKFSSRQECERGCKQIEGRRMASPSPTKPILSLYTIPLPLDAPFPTELPERPPPASRLRNFIARIRLPSFAGRSSRNVRSRWCGVNGVVVIVSILIGVVVGLGGLLAVMLFALV